MTFMGAQGLFVALIVGLLVEELIPTLGKNKKLRIKMPDAVLPAVVQSFNLLIPIIIIFVGAAVSNYLLSLVAEDGIQYINNTLQAPFVSLGSNMIPIIVLLIAEQFLWILGCSADTN